MFDLSLQNIFLQVDHFVVQPVFKKKNAELARAKRTEGNEAFQKKRYKQVSQNHIDACCYFDETSNRQ